MIVPQSVHHVRPAVMLQLLVRCLVFLVKPGHLLMRLGRAHAVAVPMAASHLRAQLYVPFVLPASSRLLSMLRIALGALLERFQHCLVERHVKNALQGIFPLQMRRHVCHVPTERTRMRRLLQNACHVQWAPCL